MFPYKIISALTAKETCFSSETRLKNNNEWILWENSRQVRSLALEKKAGLKLTREKAYKESLEITYSQQQKATHGQ